MQGSDYRLRSGRLREDLDYLELFPDGDASALPTVLVLHGNGSNKERHLQVLYRYARRGFRAVAMDLRRHGSRSNSETRDRDFMFNAPMTMIEIIHGSVLDISILLDELKIESVGVHGVSLGGITMFEALCVEPRIKAAVSIMGSPSRISLARSVGLSGQEPALAGLFAASPHNNLGHFAPRSLLMLHGALDTVVHPEGVIDLYESLSPFYVDHPDRLELAVYPEVAHETTETMLQRSIAWFEMFQSELINSGPREGITES